LDQSHPDAAGQRLLKTLGRSRGYVLAHGEAEVLTGLAPTALERAAEGLIEGGFPLVRLEEGFCLPKGSGGCSWRRQATDSLLVPGHPLLWFDRLPSTMPVARELARRGAASGLWIQARIQTHGRGRRGRTWLSPPGGLWLSLVLRIPADRLPEVGLVALVAGAAVARAISRGWSLPCGVKWPNDVLAPTGKLAGILGQSIAGGGGGGVVVLGLGINSDIAPGALPPEVRDTATTLRAAIGARRVDNDRLLAAVQGSLAGALEDWRIRGPEAALALWQEFDVTLGKEVTVATVDGDQWAGTARECDRWGRLIVDTGRCRVPVSAADTTLRLGQGPVVGRRPAPGAG